MSTAKTATGFEGKPNYWLVWEMFVNVVLALFFLRFVLINGALLLDGFRISTMLVMMKVSADAAFHLVRSPAKKISLNVYDWVIAIVGSNVLLFYTSVEGTDHWIGMAIQVLGCALQVFGMLSLNRSIGYVAANRGIKTDGMYKWVRHPLYFAYNTAFLGFLINHFTISNLVVYLVMVTFLYLRTRCEEAVLSQDPEYQAYQKKVRCRMIPFVI